MPASARASLLAACLLPVMFAGTWLGRRLTLKLSREAFIRLVTWLVLASGLAYQLLPLIGVAGALVVERWTPAVRPRPSP